MLKPSRLPPSPGHPKLTFPVSPEVGSGIIGFPMKRRVGNRKLGFRAIFVANLAGRGGQKSSTNPEKEQFSTVFGRKLAVRGQYEQKFCDFRILHKISGQ
jgi:hypothetical protein